jgi:tetratricopeptide (TPR) repeat protein
MAQLQHDSRMFKSVLYGNEEHQDLFSLRLRLHVVFWFIFLSSCAYFNTVYNAKNYYREGKKSVVHDTLKVDSESFDKAIEKATLTIVKHPGCRWVDDVLFIMGASYYYKGDYKRSLEKLDFLLTNYPESHFYDDGLYYEGLAYYKQQKYGSAIISLREAMESKPYRRKAMIALSYVYYRDGNYASLTDITQQLLHESLNLSRKRDVYRLLAEAQFEQHLYVEALESYNRLLDITRIEEDKRTLKLKIAEIYLELGEYELCRDFLAGENDAEFQTLLGDLNVEIGEIEEAKEVYLEVAHGHVTDFAAEAYYKLAQLYENEDSLELAIAYYDSSAMQSPYSEYGIEAQKKTEILNRILTLTNETDNIDRAQFLLAEIYFIDLSEFEKAIEGYQNVYENYPRSLWAPKALYAQFWITKNIIENDSVAYLLARDLLMRYPHTEYALSTQKILHGDLVAPDTIVQPDEGQELHE